MRFGNRIVSTTAVAAAWSGVSFAQDEANTRTPTSTISTVTISASVPPTSLVTSIILGPFGGEGVIVASVVAADESSTVYAMDCLEDEPCDIRPFTATQGDKDVLIHTTFAWSPISVDLSCSYSGLAKTDYLSCTWTTYCYPTSATREPDTVTQITSYADPSLYFFDVTVTAGVELLEKNPEPTETADHSPVVDADSEVFPDAEPTNSGSSTSLEGADESNDAGSDILPGAGASTAVIPVILAGVIAMF